MNVLKGREKRKWKIRKRHYTFISINADYSTLVVTNIFEYKGPFLTYKLIAYT
jgi:hypothetical protein